MKKRGSRLMIVRTWGAAVLRPYKSGKTQEHRLKPMLHVRAAYLPALRRSLGVASQSSSPLGGTRRFNSTRATPAFFSEEM